MVGLSLIVLLTMLVAWHTGWQIACPVKDMTNYTNQMKLATSLAKKIKIVQALSLQKSFRSVNQKYRAMRIAK